MLQACGVAKYTLWQLLLLHLILNNAADVCVAWRHVAWRGVTCQVRSLPGVTRVLDLPRSVVKVLWAGSWWEVATFRGLVRAPGLAAAAADAGRRGWQGGGYLQHGVGIAGWGCW
jgi:hypothetical protein